MFMSGQESGVAEKPFTNEASHKQDVKHIFFAVLIQGNDSRESVGTLIHELYRQEGTKREKEDWGISKG